MRAARRRRVLGSLAAIGCLAGALAPSGAGAALADDPAVAATIAGGAAWLQTQQTGDGTLWGFNGDWATTALAAAGVNAADVRAAGASRSLQDLWQVEYAGAAWSALPSAIDAGELGKAVLIASSAGLQPTRIAPDVNLAASLASAYRWQDGAIGGGHAVNELGFALLAFPHLGLPPIFAERAAASLLAAQHDDGGWTFSAVGGASPGDTDMTGAALAMLCSNGVRPPDPRIDAGLQFLRAKLDPATGALRTSAPGVPAINGPSHAWALTGIQACGEDPRSASWTTATGENPVTFALSLRMPDGALRYQPTSTPSDARNVNATEALVRALAGHLFSAPAPPRADPAQPAIRPAPHVPDGTPVPIALAIVSRSGPPRLCAVRIPSGTPVLDVVRAAHTAAVPNDCVQSLETAGGYLSSLNGEGAAVAGGGWVAAVSGAPDRRVGAAPVRFGDVVALRLTDGPLPPEDPPPPPGPGPIPGDPPRSGGTPPPRGAAPPARLRPAIRTAAAVVRVRACRSSAARGDGRRGRVGTATRAAACRTVRLATVACPRGTQCRVTAPRRVRVRIGAAHHALTVIAPTRVAAGRRAAIRVRLPRPALAALAGRRARVALRITVTPTAGVSVTRTLRVTLTAAGRAGPAPGPSLRGR